MNKEYDVLKGECHYIKMVEGEYDSFEYPIEVGSVIEFTIKEPKEHIITEEVLAIYNGYDHIKEQEYKIFCLPNPGVPFNPTFKATIKVFTKDKIANTQRTWLK